MLISENKKTVAIIASGIVSGVVTKGGTADLKQIAELSLSLASEIDAIFNKKKPAFVDSAQAIVTLRNAGYEVFHQTERVKRSVAFLKSQGYEVKLKIKKK
jgi:hypothetical protein